MVALGWMNLLWMGLFAGIIFGEKIWSRGIWVARAVGIGLVIIGILAIAGMLPSLMSSDTSMTGNQEGTSEDMTTMMQNNNNDKNNDDNNTSVAMSDSSPKPSMDMDMSDDSST